MLHHVQIGKAPVAHENLQEGACKCPEGGDQGGLEVEQLACMLGTGLEDRSTGVSVPLHRDDSATPGNGRHGKDHERMIQI